KLVGDLWRHLSHDNGVRPSGSHAERLHSDAATTAQGPDVRGAGNGTSLEGLFEATQVHGLDVLWEWTALSGDEELLLARTHGWHDMFPSLCTGGGRRWWSFLRLRIGHRTTSFSHC